MEEALTKNSKNVKKAARFDVSAVKDDATQRIPLDMRGKGCAQLRAKVAGGWNPGPPFGTHGRVGANELCSPSAMQEWIAAISDEVLESTCNTAHSV